MGIFDWLTRSVPFRSRTPVGQPLSGGVQVYTGFQSDTGAVITPLVAMQCSTVNACVSAIATELSKLPWNVLEKNPDGGRSIAVDHPVELLLSREVNPSMGSMTWRELILTSACLTGNGYSLIERGQDGRPQRLYFLRADEVMVQKLPDGEVIYQWSGSAETGIQLIPAYDMFHLMWNSPDGMLGYSPISLAKNAIGLAISAEAFGASYYRNCARPSGALTTDKELSVDALQRMRESWDARMKGVQSAGSVAVLEGGLKFQEISLSPQDSQFLESRIFQREEICSIFRVPPNVIGIGSTSYASAEQANREWVSNCLSTWACRLEQEANRKLLRLDEPYRTEISFDAMLRADLQTRFSIYSTARQFGFMSVNEIRAEMGRAGIGAEGDIFLQPTNMIDSSNGMGGKNFSDLSAGTDAIPDRPLDSPSKTDNLGKSEPVKKPEATERYKNRKALKNRTKK